MPSADRHWRFGVAATVLILLYGCGYVATSVWEAIAFDYEPAEFLANHPIADTLFGVLIYLSALAWLVSWWRGARMRERLRREALAGNIDTIPLAVKTPNPDNAPDVSTVPLELAWRQLNAPNPILFLLLPVLGLSALGAGLIVLLAVAGVRSPAVILGAIVLMCILGVWAIYRLMDRRVTGKRVQRLIALGTGIEWYPLRGPLHQVRWEDAQLLEVWSAGQVRRHGTVLGYTLFGRSERVEWHVLPPGLVAPVGMTLDELARRQRRLLDLIAAKTRLTPRTFVWELQAPSEQPVRRTRGFAFRLTLIYSALIMVNALLGTLAVALVLLPFTHIAPLNIGAAVVLGWAALWLTWLILETAVEQIKGPPDGIADYRLPSASMASIDEGVGFKYAARWQRRLKFILFGLALMSAALPAVLSFGELYPSLPAGGASLPTDLRKAVLFGLLLCAFVGLASFWIGLADRPTYIYADAQSIHEQDKEDVTFLPWDAILAVTVRASDGEVTSVEVIGDAATIEWPGSWTRLLPPGEQMHPVSPEQLAALVVERSGKQLHIVQAD